MQVCNEKLVDLRAWGLRRGFSVWHSIMRVGLAGLRQPSLARCTADLQRQLHSGAVLGSPAATRCMNVEFIQPVRQVPDMKPPLEAGYRCMRATK